MSSVAPAFDFRRLLDTSFTPQILAPGCVQAEGMYEAGEGVQFRTAGFRTQVEQEIVQITEGALLLASDASGSDGSFHEQLIRDSDWIHFQFRLTGGGQERVSDADVIETPDQSCVVVRYPQDSVVQRTMHAGGSLRMACLFLNPRALKHLLDASASALPERIRWIARDESLSLHAATFPLTSAMRLAVNDVLSCPYRGGARRAYMRAKSLELVSSVIHTVDGNNRRRSAATLSRADIGRIERVREIMMRELDSATTLGDLARKVGLNRTKLALGFKEVYGVSVHAYWRDEKLCRARELLQSAETRITDIALNLGYSDLSSFTRAFTRKFGQLPRSFRGHTK